MNTFHPLRKLGCPIQKARNGVVSIFWTYPLHQINIIQNWLHGLLYQKHHDVTSEGSRYNLAEENIPSMGPIFPFDSQH